MYYKNQQDINRMEDLIRFKMAAPQGSQQATPQAFSQGPPRGPPRGTPRGKPMKGRFTMISPAPPLPLSTMYSIRIGREVVGRGGPGDEIYDYNHGLTAGPQY